MDLVGRPPSDPGLLDQLEDLAVLAEIGDAPREILNPATGGCLAAMERPDRRADDGGGGDRVVVAGVF